MQYPPIRPPLRLGTLGLPQAEAGLVRAWLVLAATEPGFDWRLGQEPPYDALLADGAHLSLRSEGLPVLGERLCVLGQTSATLPAGATLMERPLRQEALTGWLSRLGVSMRATSALQVAQPAATPAGAGLAEATATRWKLRRWPPQQLLRDSRTRMRMASLLSRRALSVDELAYLSGGDPADCQVFLQMLQGFDLLEKVVRPAATPAPAPADNPAKRAASGANTALSRVVRGLRLRLGLA